MLFEKLKQYKINLIIPLFREEKKSFVAISP